jgi:hypothetical protein
MLSTSLRYFCAACTRAMKPATHLAHQPAEHSQGTSPRGAAGTPATADPLTGGAAAASYCEVARCMRDDETVGFTLGARGKGSLMVGETSWRHCAACAVARPPHTDNQPAAPPGGMAPALERERWW